MMVLGMFAVVVIFSFAGLIFLVDKTIEVPEKEEHCSYKPDCSFRFCNDDNDLTCQFDKRKQL